MEFNMPNYWASYKWETLIINFLGFEGHVFLMV